MSGPARSTIVKQQTHEKDKHNKIKNVDKQFYLIFIYVFAFKAQNFL